MSPRLFLPLTLAVACAQPQDEEKEADDVEDTAPPEVSITDPADGSEVSGVVAVTADLSDDVGVAGVRLEVDGEVIVDDFEAPLEPSWDTTLATNGEHDIRLLAADAVGNVAEDRVRVTVLNEGAGDPGVVRITNPTPGAVVCGDLPVYVWVSEPAVEVTLIVDEAEQDPTDQVPYDWIIDTEKRDDGEHYLTAVAELESGLSVSDRITITTDNDGDCDIWPRVRFIEPDHSDWVPGETLVELLAEDDELQSIEFRVDDTAIESFAGPEVAYEWDTTDLTEGAHELAAVATDVKGQVAEVRVSVTVDYTQPEAWILSPSDGDFLEGEVTVTANVTDNLGVERATLEIDGEEQTELTGEPWSWTWDTSTANGEVELILRAYDYAGNVTTHDIATYVDPAPVITLDEPVDGDTVSGEIQVLADVIDESDSVEVVFAADGVAFASDSRAPFRATLDTCELTVGAHTVEATATDTYDQTATASATVNVDQALGVELPRISGRVDPIETFTALVEDDNAIASIEFAVNGTAVAVTPTVASTPGDCDGECADLCVTYAVEADLSALDSGTHFLDVTVTNDAGESQAASAAFTVDRDVDGDGAEAEDWGGDDCDDRDSDVYVGAAEACNGTDDDCDGAADEDFDADGDGYASEAACSSGTDCDDGDADINPGGAEVCDGADNDCDGYTDVSGPPTEDDADFDSGTLNTSAADELRGNVYVPVRDMTLTSFEVDMDPGSSGTTFAVYEAGTEDGDYTLIASSESTATGGDAWYDSGSLDVTLTAGTYYLFAVGSTDAAELRQDRAPSLATDGELTPIGSIRYTGGATTDTVTTDPDTSRTYSQILHVTYEEDDDRDDDGDGQNEWCGDCDDADADRTDGGTEVCDGVDNDCDGSVPSDEADDDGDGDRVCDGDCDDADPDRYPSNAELCDGLDNDCDGDVAGDEADDDGDGVAACLDCSSGSCVIDCADDDPDELTPTWYADLDGDGYGDDTTATTECPAPADHVKVGGDCDDGDATLSPGETEICDALDNDCDGSADEGFDEDGDGYGSCDDCDDTDGAVNPGAAEVCGDATDEDCDGLAPVCRHEDTASLYDADMVVTGESSGDTAGSSLAAADINGDGEVDLFAGGPSSDSAAGDAGGAWLMFGPQSAYDDFGSGVRLFGESSSDAAGFVVALSDDLDGDAHGDLLVTAYGDDDGGSGAGAAYVLSGDTAKDGSLSQGWKLTGETSSDRFGYGAAAVGDVDDDGSDDVVVAAPDNDDVGSNAGRAYLFLGPIAADADASTADAILEGESSSDQAGTRVEAAGDLDGDGQADFFVGAIGDDDGGSAAGAIYFVRGPALSMSLSDADGKIVGGAASDQIGAAMAAGSDVDGDGEGDVLVGTENADPGGRTAAGAAYVLLGTPLGTVDVSSAEATIGGATAGDAAGAAVCLPGDLDADGYGEVFVGAPGEDSAGSGAGIASLFYGPVSGSLTMDTADALWEGEAASDTAGDACVAAGDLDGDSLPDLVVAAPLSDLSASNAGAVYMIIGAP